MKKVFRSTSAILLAFILVIALAALTGCNKGEDAASTDTSSATPPAGTMPPAAPGGAATTPGAGAPGMAGAPGAPGGVAGSDQSAGAFPKIPFKAIKLASGISTVTDKQNGVVVNFLRFKYADWSGKVNLCELPVSETKETRTSGNWINTFDIYKIQALTKVKVVKKKKAPTRLVDFPFGSVSSSDNPDSNGPSPYLPQSGGLGYPK